MIVTDLLQRLSQSDFMPHGQCFLWYPEILWLHVVSDALIALAYYIIPAALLWFTGMRREVPFRWMFFLFSMFIFACGTTHWMSIWTVWNPDYLLEGTIKFATALISIVTAILLVPIIPKALTLRNPSELENLNRALAIEINERKRAEQRFRRLLEAAPDAVVVVDVHCRIFLVNSRTEKLFGYTRKQLLGQPIETLVPQSLRGGQIRQKASDFFDPAGQSSSKLLDLWGLRQDDSQFPIEVSLSPLDTDEGTLITVAIRDVSERKAVEETLHQAQKMEAIGQLTGGVAHDFNNLLTIISGNLQILEAQLEQEPTLLKPAQAASRAAKRGAELTHKLLAYSRRQALTPRTVDLNTLIASFTDWMQRTLGEHIEIETILSKSLWKTLVDPYQVETALLNLVLNARDAMPQGGKLTIETANTWLNERAAQQKEIAPGPYVMLAVGDTGCGMPREVVNHVFEPFFTTKDAGKGSGMGLSMVYGFVKQSGGHIKIDSIPNEGTTVKLYLPRTSKESEPISKPPFKSQWPLSGQETVLVVEDEEGVRELATNLLTELGYRVLEAEDGRKALETLDREESIDLVFTDLVMPGGLSGSDLIREARQRHPGLRFLLTSGYAQNITMADTMPDDDMLLLTKPYQKEELAHNVRLALENGTIE